MTAGAVARQAASGPSMADQTPGGGPEPAAGPGQQGGAGQPALDVSALLPTFRAGDPDVQTCFSLGWHVAELFALPGRRDAAEAPVGASVLPHIAGMDSAHRLAMLVPLIEREVDRLQRRSRMEPAIRVPGIRDVADELEEARKGAADSPALKSYRKQVEAIDVRLMTALGPADFRFPKAYALGRALYAVSTGCSAAREGGWRTATALLTDRDWCTAVDGWLGDLKSSFATCATDAVVMTFREWREVAARARGGSAAAREPYPRHVERTLRRLDRQGEIWRSLLSGEKHCPDFLNMGDYLAAGQHLAGRYARLAGGFLLRAWPLVLGALALLAGLVALVTRTGQASSMIAAVTGVLGLLGVTAASAAAAVRQVLSLAEQPLWQAEITEAMVVCCSCVGHDLTPAQKRAVLRFHWQRSKRAELSRRPWNRDVELMSAQPPPASAGAPHASSAARTAP